MIVDRLIDLRDEKTIFTMIAVRIFESAGREPCEIIEAYAERGNPIAVAERERRMGLDR
jgi:hypothetical protein